MAKRPSLSGNVKRTAPDAAKAVEVARKLSGQGEAPQDADTAPEYETVSYNLPVDLIDLWRDLAKERHRIDQETKRQLRREIRAAKRAGRTPPVEPPPQARESASAIMREAMEAYRPTVEAELAKLRGE
jgi:hypothetical protein